MNKTKLIALCGICGAVAVVCLVALSYVKWFALALAVVAAVVVCCPQMLDGKYVWYSVATYFAATVVGVLLGNVVYVAPVAIFAMPCAIWKLHCRHKQAKGKQWQVFKWLGNYLLAAVALVATALLMSALMPATWQNFVQNKWFVLIVAASTIVGTVAYDKLLDGAIYWTKNVLQKSKFGQ